MKVQTTVKQRQKPRDQQRVIVDSGKFWLTLFCSIYCMWSQNHAALWHINAKDTVCPYQFLSEKYTERNRVNKHDRHIFEFVPTVLQIWPKVSWGCFFLPAEHGMADPLPHGNSGILLSKPGSRQPPALPLLSSFRAQKMRFSKETCYQNRRFFFSMNIVHSAHWLQLLLV